jgi:hypothetical protein
MLHLTKGADDVARDIAEHQFFEAGFGGCIWAASCTSATTSPRGQRNVR